MQSAKSQAPASKTNSPTQANIQQLPTFLDHVHELRRRLFWVVASVLVASSIAYSFLGTILDVLTMPLGDERLFYLTPGGGLSFSFMLCAYVGVMVAVPLIMYHLYRFLEPLMGQWRRSTIFYVGLSTLLAATGVLFAYFVSLPAAIKFLTGFNVNHIQAMLTADSYLSFVVTYLLGAALLFQIPLLLLIINTMTPLKPSKLMKLQKFVIVGAFILAAIISPTPDIMNQLFLAVPVIGMYQLGILMVWAQNRVRARKRARIGRQMQLQTTAQQRQAVAPLQRAVQPLPASVLEDLRQSSGPRPQQYSPQKPIAAVPAQPVRTAVPRVQPLSPPSPRPRVFSDIAPRRVSPAVRPVVATRRPAAPAPAARPAASISVPARSIDGFRVYRPVQAGSS